MAKDQEKNLAYFYFTEGNLIAKEIAEKVKVRENTVSDWIKKGNWKKLRDANTNQSTQRLDRIHQVIDEISNERLDIIKEIKLIPVEIKKLEKDIREIPNTTITDPMKEQVNSLKSELKDLKRSAVYNDQSIAMWNKTLQSFHKDNKITLSVYLEIQNRIFEDLRSKDESLYMKTLDFQHEHILEVSTTII